MVWSHHKDIIKQTQKDGAGRPDEATCNGPRQLGGLWRA